MKFILLFLLVILFCSPLLYPDTADSLEIIKFSQRNPLELELKVKIKPSLAIGYANCFKGEVLEVVRGNIADEKILFTVLAGDEPNYKIFSSAGENDILLISFVFNKSNEPYGTAYVTGFVDSDRNSWRITGVIKK